MSITTEFSPPSTKTSRTDIVESVSDITDAVGSNNKTLVIVLAVTLPTLACIALVTTLIICYRRRQTTIWLKKLENSSQLQAIVVNLSPTSIESQYPVKKPRLSHRPYLKPRTETIVYNRLSTPPTSVVNNPLKSTITGETNVAFDEYLIKNEEQPILKTSNNDQQTTTLQSDFPISRQAPVRTITSALVEVIASHRLALLADKCNTSSETSSSGSTSNSSRHSGGSPQTVLLFSQRTQF